MLSEVTKQLSADPQSFVDLVSFVNVGVIDEALPADRGPGLLKVGAHDNEQVASEVVCQRFQLGAVFNSGGGIVDRAWSNYDDEAVIFAFENSDALLAGTNGGLYRLWRGRNFRVEESGRDEGVIAKNYTE